MSGELPKSKKLLESELERLKLSLQEVILSHDNNELIGVMFLLCELKQQLEIIILKMTLITNETNSNDEILKLSSSTNFKNDTFDNDVLKIISERKNDLSKKCLTLNVKKRDEIIENNDNSNISVKERPKLNLKLEEDFIIFINTYCNFDPSKSIQSTVLTNKYNEINGTNLTPVRVGVTMTQIVKILPIKKDKRSNATYYSGIEFKEL